MRVQGGTAGLLAAIDAGKVDPLDPDIERTLGLCRPNGADRRKTLRRDRARRKREEARRRERMARPSPF